MDSNTKEQTPGRCIDVDCALHLGYSYVRNRGSEDELLLWLLLLLLLLLSSCVVWPPGGCAELAKLCGTGLCCVVLSCNVLSFVVLR